MVRTLLKGLLTDGIAVPLAKLCVWFSVPRQTVYDKPIKAMTEKEPSVGYRTVAWLLRLNKKHGPEDLPVHGLTGMQAPDRQGATHRNGVLRGRRTERTLVAGPLPGLVGARWLNHAAFVFNCRTLTLLDWHTSPSARATTAVSALEHAVIVWIGPLGHVPQEFQLMSDNKLALISRKYTVLVRSGGLKQGLITRHRPQQNGMAERVIRTLNAQCVHRQRFDSIQQVTRAIGN